MMNRKIALTLLTMAVLGLSVLALGCTSSAPAGTPTAAPTGASNPLTGKVTIMGSSSVGPHLDKGSNLSNAFSAAYPKVSTEVSISDSGTGIKGAETGVADLGMSSRALTAADGADLNYTIIAYDGIAIIVNKASPISDLSRQQIQDIFAGKITSWKQVGGSDAPITVFQREASSGTRSAFNSLVMGSTNVTTDALTATNTLNMIQSVKGNPNAIGYCSYGELSSDVKALQVGGVAPSQATIKDKSYSIQRPFLLVTKGTPTNPAAIAYIDFVLSPQGQSLLAQDNLVPVA